jgi:hypothetical protein
VDFDVEVVFSDNRQQRLLFTAHDRPDLQELLAAVDEPFTQSVVEVRSCSR